MIINQFFIILPAPEEKPDDLMSAEYVAHRFGCSLSSVYQGKCGTHGIRPVSRDPWRALRSHVEEEHAKFVGKKEEPRKKKGLIRRGRKDSI